MKTSSNREQQLFLVTGGAILFLIMAVVVFNMISTPGSAPEEVEEAQPRSKVHTAEAQTAESAKGPNDAWNINIGSGGTNQPLPQTQDNAVYLSPKEIRPPGDTQHEAAPGPGSELLGKSRQLLEPGPAKQGLVEDKDRKIPHPGQNKTASLNRDPGALEAARLDAESEPGGAVSHAPVEKPGNKPPLPVKTPKASAERPETSPEPPKVPLSARTTEVRPEPPKASSSAKNAETRPEPPRIPLAARTTETRAETPKTPIAPKTTEAARSEPAKTLPTPKTSETRPESPKAARASKPADTDTTDYSEAISQVIARQLGEGQVPEKPAATARSPGVTKPAASPSSGSSYQIQIAAFATADKAKAMADRLGSLMFQGRRMPVNQSNATVSGKTYFRVRAGPFSNRNNAEAALQFLGQKAGVSGSIVGQD